MQIGRVIEASEFCNGMLFGATPFSTQLVKALYNWFGAGNGGLATGLVPAIPLTDPMPAQWAIPGIARACTARRADYGCAGR
jgi:hypothetical protein